MNVTTHVLPDVLHAMVATIAANADEVTALDQAIGDGDHVYNLQRGLQALLQQQEELLSLEWGACLQKIGMTLMSTVGGASGSLYGTLFLALSKALHGRDLDLPVFAEIFSVAVVAVKQRGKADVGEKTMLDVYIPVADYLNQAQHLPLTSVLTQVQAVAASGVEATRDMLATKGRASFLGERSRGHIDAGAKTAQLMITALAQVLLQTSATPA